MKDTKKSINMLASPACNRSLKKQRAQQMLLYPFEHFSRLPMPARQTGLCESILLFLHSLRITKHSFAPFSEALFAHEHLQLLT